MYANYKFSDLTPLADVKSRVFTPDLDGLIAWLRTQDGATEYDSWSVKDCLMCRFASAAKGTRHDPRKTQFSKSVKFLGRESLECEKVAYGDGGYTYAAALTRAIALREVRCWDE